MAGKPKMLSEDERELLALVPPALKKAYELSGGDGTALKRVRNPRSEIAADFGVSPETVRDWLYKNAFPISRWRQFARSVLPRLQSHAKLLNDAARKIERDLAAIREFENKGLKIETRN